MILGKTDAERERDLKTLTRIFALLSRRLDDGRTVIGEWVERYLFEDKAANWAGDSSGWRYRMPSEKQSAEAAEAAEAASALVRDVISRNSTDQILDFLRTNAGVRTNEHGE